MIILWSLFLVLKLLDTNDDRVSNNLYMAGYLLKLTVIVILLHRGKEEMHSEIKS